MVESLESLKARISELEKENAELKKQLTRTTGEIGGETDW